jgi:hypothetical protein
MSCKELLERKKTLLESIEAEEVARKALLRAVNGLIEDVGKDGMSTADAVMTDCVRSLGDIMSGLLKKKHGAQHYDSQLYLACQNAQDALYKIASGASAAEATSDSIADRYLHWKIASGAYSAAVATSDAVAESGPNRSDGAGGSSSSSSSSAATNSNNNNASAPKKLSSTALGLLKFEQLVKLLKENEEADHDENLVVLLTRMQALKSGLTAEKVKESGAGKLVSKLAKHRIREVRNRAEATIRAWKEALMQPEETSKDKVRDKGPAGADKGGKSDKHSKSDSTKVRDKGPAGADKGGKSDKHSKSDSTKNERNPNKAEKERKVERGASKPSKEEKKGTKEREAGSKRPRGGDSDSSGGDGDDMDRWMKQRKKELAAQYARVEEEEEVSRIVGETEDDLAELEEIRAAKRRLQHQK